MSSLTITSKARAGAGRRPGSTASRSQNRQGWAYVAPTAAVLLILFVAPIIVVIIMACSRWTLLGGSQGVNFPDNFTKVFSNQLLGTSIWFTVKYTVLTTVILMPIAYGLALLVQESRHWNSILRTAILVPSALGIASASLLFYALYSPQVGPINSTMTIVQLIYRDAFETRKDLGMAAALSVLLLLALVIINLVQLRAMRFDSDSK